MPARRIASAPLINLPPSSALPAPISGSNACEHGARSLSPTEATDGTTGCTPLFSIAAMRSASAGDRPAAPWVRPTRRAASSARTSAVPKRGPIPTERAISTRAWKSFISAAVRRVSTPAPRPVLRP